MRVRPALFLSLLVLGLGVAAAQTQSQDLPKPPRRILVSRIDFAGDPASDKTAKPHTVRIEEYDAEGRLSLLVLPAASPTGDQTGAPGSQAAPQAGQAAPQAGPGPSAAAATGSPSGTGAGPAAATLSWRQFRYDGSGRLVEQSQGSGEGPQADKKPIRSTILRDAKGMPLRVTVEQGGKVLWRLEYGYQGQGSLANAVLRDGGGKLVAVDEIGIGAGAGEGRAYRVRRSGADGSLVEERYAAVEARGFLSRLEISPRSGPAAPAAAETPAPGAGSTTANDQTLPSAGDSGPGAGATGAEPPPPGAFLIPSPPGEGPWRWGALAAAGLPDPLGRAGSVSDYLYDGEGRLARARQLEADGSLITEADYHYDARGFLAAEDLAAGGEAIKLVFVYPSALGLAWTERRAYLDASPASGPDVPALTAAFLKPASDERRSFNKAR